LPIKLGRAGGATCRPVCAATRLHPERGCGRDGAGRERRLDVSNVLGDPPQQLEVLVTHGDTLS
jgi:hypothetical protein